MNTQKLIQNRTHLYIFVSCVFYIAIFILKIAAVGISDQYILSWVKLGIKCLIPIYVFMVFYYSLSGNIRTTRLVSCALFFAFLADTTINWFPNLPGVVIFCLTHACLIAFYFKTKHFEKHELLYLLPFVIIFAIYYCVVRDDIPSGLLTYGIPVYLGILTIMVWRSVCLWRNQDHLQIIIGSILFYITDMSVILELLYSDQLILVVLTWVAYPPALFLLSTIEHHTFEV